MQSHDNNMHIIIKPMILKNAIELNINDEL